MERGGRDEAMDEYCEAAFHVNTIWTVFGDAPSVMSGSILVADFESGAWRLGIYSGIFLWTWRFGHGCLETVFGSHEPGEKGQEKRQNIIQQTSLGA